MIRRPYNPIDAIVIAAAMAMLLLAVDNGATKTPTERRASSVLAVDRRLGDIGVLARVPARSRNLPNDGAGSQLKSR